MKLKKGDSVIVIAGKNKGATGTISAVLPAKNKVIIDKVNVAKRHTVARGQNTKSEIAQRREPCGHGSEQVRVLRSNFGMLRARVVAVHSVAGSVGEAR